MSVNPMMGHLPWTGKPAQEMPGLTGYLRKRMDEQDGRYLPDAITLFADQPISSETISEFMTDLVGYLTCEIRQRKQRVQKLLALGLLGQDDIDDFLVGHTNSQPWALYGEHGGLGSENVGREYWQAPRGVIPFSTILNHGVSWWHSCDVFNVWLASAGKVNHEWDWDSDIGHESAHAAFAPLPLYMLTADLTSTLLHVESLKHKREIKPGHLARMIYAYSEMAVIAMRGEPRSTAIGTPVVQQEEIFALLKLSHELMPRLGSDRALEVYESTTGWLDVEYGMEIIEVAAPMVRILPRFKRWLRSFTPPSLHNLRISWKKEMCSFRTPRHRFAAFGFTKERQISRPYTISSIMNSVPQQFFQ